MNKYHNRKVSCDGHIFDSKHEAHRYCELRLLLNAGEISDLRLQVPFELIPAQFAETGEKYTRGSKAGKPKMKCVERAVKYIADFVYIDNASGETVVEDAKGYTGGGAYGIFKIKRKLMLYRHGIKIKEV